MIYITRPVRETHKTVAKSTGKVLDNNLRERKSTEHKDISLDKVKVYNRESLDKAIEDSNRVLFGEETRFQFKIHEGTGRVMVKLVNIETDEVIKEIPPEKILDLVASIWDLVGILVDERG